jgi:UDP-N-acetylglucosamine diphosphorylase / glucose-1-phosphate thymidylyltransferase / UDP-N-acetylgalactosamine diphosphorylase / glucosamine-1-phosphate N-acetyltransferase / galactosamine-1-phosphate N-acetyltransferase
MADTALYLFDDSVARSWQPFTLTRPAGELLLGAFTARARAESMFRLPCAGHIAAPHLRGFQEPGAPPVVAHGDVATDRDRIFLSSRVIPDWGQAPDLPRHAAPIRTAGQVVGWHAPAGSPGPDPGWFSAPEAGDGVAVELPGRVLDRVWALVALNAEQIRKDFAAAGVGSADQARDFHCIGYQPGMLRTGSKVTIEAGAVLDFSHGPIWLEDGVTVRAFTRLAGPAWVGPGSTLLGGSFTAVSIGPVCKVHGEVEETVVLGYSNKAHDGFLGHAYLGRWVNLGAMTTNSDLKNNYGTIRIWTPEGDVDTGLTKLGCLLGDHVKTGIGSLLNTGTVVGAGSNLFGSEMPPKHVPPFSWGSGSELVAFDRDRFLALAQTVMKRRDLELPDGMRAMLSRAWDAGRAGA